MGHPIDQADSDFDSGGFENPELPPLLQRPSHRLHSSQSHEFTLEKMSKLATIDSVEEVLGKLNPIRR
jgi:hypothetical protein